MSLKFTDREIRFLEENPDTYVLLKNHHDCSIAESDAINDNGIFDGCIEYHETRIKQLQQERLRLEALI